MKKRIILLTMLSINVSLFGQDLSGTLEGNNIRATISNTGIFFKKVEENSSGYESPKGEGNHLLYSTSFWFGAKDEWGNIKMAADLFSGEDRDTYPGALKDDGTAEAPDIPYADEIYFVSKAEIEYHVANYYNPAYVAPHGIAAWPAHGDLEMDEQLAPFADLNGNMVYEPELGEYPEIRGDHAAYLIMNDMAGPHTTSEGDPLGIEIHYMFYQYETEDVINNTTFINVRVINRSSNNYPEFVTSVYMDCDVGYGLNDDDYIGCNPDKNYMFGYNGDAFDEGGGLEPGYGENPPAVGFLLLNNEMNVSGYFDGNIGPYGYPTSAADFWNYQHAIWKNETHFEFGGNGNTTGSGEPTNFMYPSDPTLTGTDPDLWSEPSENNPKGERRMHMSATPMSFAPGEVICYDFAVMTSSREGNSFENASSLSGQADEIQAFYNAQPDSWCDFTLGISEELAEKADFKLYPNPTSGTFTVDFQGSYALQLFTLEGQLVYTNPSGLNQEIIHVDLNAGIYLVRIMKDGNVYQRKLVVH